MPSCDSCILDKLLSLHLFARHLQQTTFEIMVHCNDIQPIQNNVGPCLESLVPLLDLLLVVSGVLAEVLDVVARQPVALPALRRHTANESPGHSLPMYILQGDPFNL